jgi:hypothetical protein
LRSPSPRHAGSAHALEFLIVVRGMQPRLGMGRSERWLLTLLACWLVCSSSAVRAGGGNDWRTVREQQGIVVTVRDEPGREVPTFRGHGVVEGAILHVLAILLDDARVREWSKDVDESCMLRSLDARTHIVYSRSRQTWPVRDRDLVMKRTVHVLTPGSAYDVHLVCVAGEKPPIPGVIRIRDCDTRFLLRKLSERSTSVDYQVRVDPGGSSPGWLVRAVSEQGPLDTLLALREQVERTRGQYSAVMRTWAP